MNSRLFLTVKIDQPHKMIKHTQANCFSVFDDFVGLHLKGNFEIILDLS